jgi:hypothetical protein
LPLVWMPGDICCSSEALNELIPLVYDQLRQLAAIQLRRERANHTRRRSVKATIFYNFPWPAISGCYRNSQSPGAILRAGRCSSPSRRPAAWCKAVGLYRHARYNQSSLQLPRFSPATLVKAREPFDQILKSASSFPLPRGVAQLQEIDQRVSGRSSVSHFEPRLAQPFRPAKIRPEEN